MERRINCLNCMMHEDVRADLTAATEAAIVQLKEAIAEQKRLDSEDESKFF